MLRKPSIQLFNGRSVGSLGPGLNNIGNSFRLCEINFAVDEGAQRKLTGFSSAGSGSKEKIKNLLGDIVSAMGADLYNILAGVRMGISEHGGKNGIHGLTGFRINHGTVMNGVRHRISKNYLTAKHGIGSRKRMVAADSYNGYTAGSRRCCYRRNRVLRIVHVVPIKNIFKIQNFLLTSVRNIVSLICVTTLYFSQNDQKNVRRQTTYGRHQPALTRKGRRRTRYSPSA
jgi:hypothetical protein